MKCRVTIGEKVLEVESVGLRDGKSVFLVDGLEVLIDAGPLNGPFCEVRATSGAISASMERLPARAGARTGLLKLLANGCPVTVQVETERDRLRATSRARETKKDRVTARSILPGIIRRVMCKVGDVVKDGEAILTLEAMKMENEVRAEISGRVTALLVKEGQVVNSGDALAEIEEAGASS